METSLLSNTLQFHRLSSYDINNSEQANVLPRDTIKLLTYNFFLRPPPIKNNKDDYKEERLNDFKEVLSDFDIICFQELFGSFHNRKHKMIKNASENGFFYTHGSSSPSFFSKFLIDGGLLVLSRFPIVDKMEITFNYGLMSDAMSMKGAVYTKIKIKDSYLCLFTSHLQASYFDSGVKLWNSTISTREDQEESLINFIYNVILKIPPREKDKCMFILCGDLNIDAYENKDGIQRYGLPTREISEYSVLMNKLRHLGTVNDLSLKKYKKHPYTFGVNDQDYYDQVLTCKEDVNSHQTLDYIFEIIPDYSKNIYSSIKNKENLMNKGGDNENLIDNEQIADEDDIVKLRVKYSSFKVEEFLVKDRPYQQLSDHFGVSVEIGLKSKDYEEVDLIDPPDVTVNRNNINNQQNNENNKNTDENNIIKNNDYEDIQIHV